MSSVEAGIVELLISIWFLWVVCICGSSGITRGFFIGWFEGTGKKAKEFIGWNPGWAKPGQGGAI